MTQRRPFYFLFFALVPLLFIIQARERSEFVHQIGLTFLKPILITAHTASHAIHESGDRLSRFWNLYGEHQKLTERVQELESRVGEMDELKKENQRLGGLLDFKKETSHQTIPARVIGRDLAPWRKTLLIDKGSHHGIKKRMAVVNARGLVGRVVETGPLTARAILLLDPESRVSVLFQEDRDLGVAEGDGSSFLRVTHIDREASVKVGERVVSSGLGGIYPKGIGVGTVEMVGNEKEGLELFATVRPFVQFSKLEEVLVVTNPSSLEASSHS